MVHRTVFPTDQGRGAEPSDFRELGLRQPVALSDPSDPRRREDAEVHADRFELDPLGFPIEELEATLPTSTHREVHGQVHFRFAHPIAERMKMFGRVDRLCPHCAQDCVCWSTAVRPPVEPVSITIIPLIAVPTHESCVR